MCEKGIVSHRLLNDPSIRFTLQDGIPFASNAAETITGSQFFEIGRGPSDIGLTAKLAAVEPKGFFRIGLGKRGPISGAAGDNPTGDGEEGLESKSIVEGEQVRLFRNEENGF